MAEGNKKDNTTGIRQHAKTRQAESRKKALTAIKALVRKGEKITIYAIWKQSGCSRSFLTKDPIVRAEIDKYRQAKPEKTQESKAVTTTALHMEIAKLKRIIKKMNEENGDTWKEKYNKVKAENEELKQQLKSIYTDIKKESRCANA